jgi:hypothetical protein
MFTAGRGSLTLLGPELVFSQHSAHPWGGNDGPLRAGRGDNLLVSLGVALRLGRLEAMILPQVVQEANRLFQVLPYPQPVPPVRNVWANPFYRPGNSMDYPQRFADASRSALKVQGRLALRAHRAAVIGVGNESRWWGPGIENALLLSSNAPGFAHVFVESPGAISASVGSFEYAVLLGQLRESAIFDFDPSNDQRALSAASLVWTPPASWGVLPTLGVSRAVMSLGAPRIGDALGFLRDAGRPWTVPADTLLGRDQITTVFLRYRVPRHGLETWAEWARYEQPASLRDFLVQPGHAQGYTLGAQLLQPVSSGMLHLATEFSYAEPSPSLRVRPVQTTYTGSAVPQGWTHEGQMLGPWIGPAASSQWAAADYHAEKWRAGFVLGRYRRDGHYRHVNPIPLKREDIQLYASLRGGVRVFGWDAFLELTDGARLNHLFQAYPIPGTSGNDTEGIDLRNRSIALTLAHNLPRVFRR